MHPPTGTHVATNCNHIQKHSHLRARCNRIKINSSTGRLENVLRLFNGERLTVADTFAVLAGVTGAVVNDG